MSGWMNTSSCASLIALTVVLACTGCASEPDPPPPVPGAAKYHRAFDAAQAAAGEVGIAVRTSDRDAGRILGSKDGVEVMIWLQWQPSGSTKVEFNPTGTDKDPKLGEKWLAAYNRRMGR
jgi:hypothetical protein